MAGDVNAGGAKGREVMNGRELAEDDGLRAKRLQQQCGGGGETPDAN